MKAFKAFVAALIIWLNVVFLLSLSRLVLEETAQGQPLEILIKGFVGFNVVALSITGALLIAVGAKEFLQKERENGDM